MISFIIPIFKLINSDECIYFIYKNYKCYKYEFEFANFTNHGNFEKIKL